MKASKQYCTRLLSAFLSKQLGTALNSSCILCREREGWQFLMRVFGSNASLSMWILRISFAILRCSTCEIGISTRNTIQSLNATFLRLSADSCLKSSTSIGSRNVSMRYQSSVWMQSSQNYSSAKLVEMSIFLELSRSFAFGSEGTMRPSTGPYSFASLFSAFCTCVCFLPRFLAYQCQTNHVPNILRESSLKIQSASLRQALLVLMMQQISRAISPCLSVICVANLIYRKSYLSRSLKTPRKTYTFLPLVISFSTSYRAQYEDFLRPPKVPLLPQIANNPNIRSSAIPNSSISASSCETTGVLGLKKYSSIFLRWTDTLAMRLCRLLWISVRMFLMNSVAAPFSSFFFIQPDQIEIFFNNKMDIKINFDQLFGAALAADLNTTHTSLQPNSIELSHDLTASLNNSVQYKFSFNHQFFEEELDNHEQDHFQADHFQPQRPPKSTKSIKVTSVSQANKPQKPGQRLFYQSQQQQQRKIKEREKIHQEKQIEFSKSVTFVPSINQNSRRIAERHKNQQRQYHKTKNMPKPTVELIEEANQKECTFHPKLIAKNKNKTKPKDELFYYLHNTAKIKDIKIHQLAEEQYGQYATNIKKGNQEDITNFLKRNEDYSSVVKKKQEILKDNSEKYDLKTGERLFSPKIMENKAYNFHATASSKDLKSYTGKSSTENFKTNDRNEPKQEPNQRADYAARPKSGIFNKKYKTQSSEDYTYPYQTRQQQRRNQSIHHQASRSRHQVIVQVQENSIVQCERDHKVQQLNIFNPYQQDEIQGEQLNIWGSNEIKPFQLSNVNQYLNASDEEETEHKGNYVMDILNNLIIKQDEDA